MSESTKELENLQKRLLEKLNEPLLKKISELEQQIERMELRNELIEEELSKTVSRVLDGPRSEEKSKPQKATVTVSDQKERSWQFRISSLSHFAWQDDTFEAYFLTSSGEKIVRIKSDSKEKISSELSERLIEKIQKGDDFAYQFELGQVKLTTEVPFSK